MTKTQILADISKQINDVERQIKIVRRRRDEGNLERLKQSLGAKKEAYRFINWLIMMKKL